MAEIIARWEWRTFGHDFGPAEPHLAALAAEKVQESEEIYLLSGGDDVNVKVRDSLMDLKVLERVDENGLEQWRPVLKAPFPLDAPSVAQIGKSLGVPLHATTLAPSLDRLLADLSAAGGDVRVVNVSKRRTRYHIGGCVAELTEVIANGRQVRTAAIEGEDPARVVAAVRSMELDGFPNTSYPRGLKQIIGQPEGSSRS
jgi:exopolyphosphatase/guanosine-5'-triphosphate,3'-diphosphate pyrophosphatase